MIRLSIDTLDILTEVFSGDPVTVSRGMFGGILVGQNPGGTAGYFESYDELGLTVLRWPGGSLAENGVVTEEHRIRLTGSGGEPYAYDLGYPDLIHPDVLEHVPGILGLSDVLAQAVQRGSVFSLILPTIRYDSSPEDAKADIYEFLVKLFVERQYDNGALPGKIIIEIGNENYDPLRYGVVASAALEAIMEFRVAYPEIEFSTALQAMPTGPQTEDLVDIISESSDNPALALSQVDIIRLHYLTHDLDAAANIEHRGPRYYAISEIQRAIEEARDQVLGPTAAELGLYFSAYTSSSRSLGENDPMALSSAGVLLSLFSGMLELGADYAAAWGIATWSPETVTITQIGPGGQVISSASGILLGQMAMLLPGMNLIGNELIDSVRSSPIQVQTYSNDSQVVIFIAANDLVDDRDTVRIDLDGMDGIGSIWATEIRTLSGLSGAAEAVHIPVTIQGRTLSVDISGDYRVVTLVLTRVTPGDSPIVQIGYDASENLTGGRGADSLSGSGGDDTIRGVGGDDELLGGEGSDVIYGGRGDDWIDGGEGADLLFGGEDNDHLVDSYGNDTFYGGAGDDWIEIGTTTAEVTGGEGSDLLDLSSIESSRHIDALVDLQAGIASIDVSGEDGVTRNSVIVRGIEAIVGVQNGNNYLYGDAGANTIYGGDRTNVIDGGGGADSIFGGLETNWIYGGDGSDLLVSRGKFNYLVGGAGNDTLVASALEGSTSMMYGGAGADEFVFVRGMTTPLIFDFDALEGDRIVWVEAHPGGEFLDW